MRKRRPNVPKRVMKSDRGVVYLSHVPHGFYEKEMKDFFSQFGQVSGIRIPKSTVSHACRSKGNSTEVFILTS